MEFDFLDAPPLPAPVDARPPETVERRPPQLTLVRGPSPREIELAARLGGIRALLDAASTASPALAQLRLAAAHREIESLANWHGDAVTRAWFGEGP